MIAKENKYGGVVVDIASLPEVDILFEKELQELLFNYAHKQLLWLTVPIKKASFVPVLSANGFVFHHCDDTALTMVKQMTAAAFIPTAQNYLVGVGAIVMNEGNILVIRDRYIPGYKLPGGHVDNKESIKEAIVREVLEETGVCVECDSIVNIGHFRNGQFGESNLYIMCTTRTLSTTIAVQDTEEVLEALWMPLDDFLASDEVNVYYKSVVRSAIEHPESRLMNRAIRLKAPDAEIFF